MAPRKKPEIRLPKSGFSFFSLLVAFLLGFGALPLYFFLNYEMYFKPEQILLLKKKTKDTRAQVPAEPVKEPAKPLTEPVSSQPEPPKITMTPAQEKAERDRWVIKKAVLDYNQKYPRMEKLNIFELIGKGYLKEIPNCPDNQVFQISYTAQDLLVTCARP